MVYLFILVQFTDLPPNPALSHESVFLRLVFCSQLEKVLLSCIPMNVGIFFFGKGLCQICPL